MSLQLIILSAYFLILISIGIFAKSKVKTSSDYLLAGRNLGVGLCTATVLGEWLGAMSTVGTAERAFISGLSPLWYNVSTGTGMMIFSFTLATVYRKKSVHTVAEMIETLFNRSTRFYSAIGFIIAYTILAYVQVQGAGALIAASLGVSLSWGIVIAGIVITLYTTLGGLWSISLTNLIHTVLLYMVIIALFIIGLQKVGGYQGLHELLITAKGAEQTKAFFSPIGIGIPRVISWFVGGIMGVFAAQASIQPIFAARDWKVAKKSSLLTGLMILPIGFFISTIGMIAASGRFGFPHDAKQALPYLLMNSEFVHPVLGGLAMAGILAAILSTIAPVMFAISTIITKDIYQRFINPTVKDARLFKLSRILTLTTGIYIVPLALYMRGLILDTAYVSYAIRGVAAVVVLFGVYISSLRNNKAALWTIIVGTVFALIASILQNRIYIDKVYAALLSGIFIYLSGVIIMKITSK